jgi:hypothetical protein
MKIQGFVAGFRRVDKDTALFEIEKTLDFPSPLCTFHAPMTVAGELPIGAPVTITVVTDTPARATKPHKRPSKKGRDSR